MRVHGLALKLVAASLAAITWGFGSVDASAQQEQIPHWRQICDHAQSGTNERSACSLGYAICGVVNKIRGSTTSLDECMDKALSGGDSAAGQNIANHQTCQNADDDQTVIRACSAVLASGQDSPAEEVEDRISLGAKLLNNAQYDPAIDDLSKLISVATRLPPGDGRTQALYLAYEGRCLARGAQGILEGAIADCTNALSEQTDPKELARLYKLRSQVYGRLSSARGGAAYLRRSKEDEMMAHSLDPSKY